MKAGKRSSGPCVATSRSFANSSSAETPKSSRSGSTERKSTKSRARLHPGLARSSHAPHGPQRSPTDEATRQELRREALRRVHEAGHAQIVAALVRAKPA